MGVDEVAPDQWREKAVMEVIASHLATLAKNPGVCGDLIWSGG
jgi:hypothetical protein